jgi:hypothetical protein
MYQTYLMFVIVYEKLIMNLALKKIKVCTILPLNYNFNNQHKFKKLF